MKGHILQTMILRLLWHRDRNAILNGTREAPIQDASRLLRFYADYSAHTSQRWKAFVDIQKSLTEKGISSFMIYPATLKIILTVSNAASLLGWMQRSFYKGLNMGSRQRGQQLVNKWR